MECVLCVDNLGFNQQLLLSGLGRVFRSPKLRTLISLPPYTPPVWVSVFTGYPPWVHGVGDFIDRVEGRPVTAYDVRVPYVWGLRRFGRWVVHGLPITYPAKASWGEGSVVVSGWDSPRPSAYPIKYLRFSNWWWERECFERVVRIKSLGAVVYDASFIIKSLTSRVLKLKSLMLEVRGKADYFIAYVPENDWLRHVSPYLSDYSGYLRELMNELVGLAEFMTANCDSLTIISDHDSMYYREVINLYPFITEHLLDVYGIRKLLYLLGSPLISGRLVTGADNLLESGIFIRRGRNRVLPKLIKVLNEDLGLRCNKYYKLLDTLPDIIFTAKAYEVGTALTNEPMYWERKEKTVCGHSPHGVVISDKGVINREYLLPWEVITYLTMRTQ